jgi:DNA-binding transcriptional MerR regulator
MAKRKSRGDAVPSEHPDLMKTSEVLAKSGVTRQMFYLYSTMGLVDPAATTAAGHRLYDRSVLARLKIIRNAVETGYALRDVKEVFFSRPAK